MDGVSVDPAAVHTNIVIFELRRADMTPAQLASGLREQGVLLSPMDGNRLRAVTHYHVGPYGHRAHPGRLSRGLVGERAHRVERAWATWSTSGSLTLR
jgi:threonine aldolase